MNDVVQVEKCFDTDDTKSFLMNWSFRHSGTPVALPSVTAWSTSVSQVSYWVTTLIGFIAS